MHFAHLEFGLLGLSPAEVDSNAYYTKVEVNELLAQNLSSAQDYADGQDAATLASATAYTDEKIAEIDLSEYATDADLQAAKTELDGKIALKQDKITSENKLPYSLISDTPAIPTKTSELTNDSTFQTAQDVQNAISGKADTSALTAHTSDTAIHVTSADKTNWNGKLDPSALNGYATEQYVNGQVSGKANKSYVDEELAKKQNTITSENKLPYSLVSDTPDLSIYAKPNCLRLTAKAANSTVGLKLAGNATAKNVEWSSDEGTTWTAFTWTNGYTNVVTLANAGDSIILRCNDGQFSTGDADWVQFVLTGSIAASGNVMSLLSNDALLDEVPALAFMNLFRDQTALVEAPELPAMKLNYRSYFCMFYGCSLAHAPKLPAEQYAAQCYGSMFGGGHQTFTSIEIAGQWDALGNDTSAMEKMFKGCSALNSVTIHWTNWPRTGGTTNWLQNVSATGKFYCSYGLPIIRDASHIPAGWEIEYLDVPEEVLAGKLNAPSGGTAGQVLTKTAEGAEWADPQGGNDSTDYLTFTAEQANSTISLNKRGDVPSLSSVLEYSTDGETWTNYEWSGTAGTVITLANVGDYVKFRGDNATFSTEYYNGEYAFAMTGKIAGSGNIMSLLDKSCLLRKINRMDCFNKLFLNCSSLTKAPELPATELAESCYSSMFEGCSNLTTSPHLPAINLANYCYSNMFKNCTNLTSVPDIHVNVVNQSSFSSTFYGCSKLRSIRIITDDNPKSGWSETFNSAFYNCSNLIYVYVSFIGNYGNSTRGWLQNVSPTGTFYCPYGLDTSIRDASHIPVGWNVVYTSVPEEVVNQANAATAALTLQNN